MTRGIRNWIRTHREEILATNRRVVSLPSENLYPFGNELQVQQEVAKILKDIGFQTDVFLPTDVPGLLQHEGFLNDGRCYEDRPNVVGVLKGRGLGKSLIFSGHMDTVPRGLDTWNYAPFGADVVGDRQYGLGIFDMKGGMVAAMMAARCVQELGYALEGDLMIECVVDEEFGGANGTLACRLRGYAADVAIIPEPTNLAICPVNQGGAYYRLTFEGVAGRAYSGEQLLNPVFAASRFLEVIRQYDQWRNEHANVPRMFDWNPKLPTLVQSLHAGDVSTPLSDRVPRTCWLDLWMQCFPGITEDEFHAEFVSYIQPFLQNDELISKLTPKIERKIRFLPGTGISEDHPILDTLQRVGRMATVAGLDVHGAPFACDSFVFNLYSNTPAVILGPSGGNAHAIDEYIHVEDFLTLIEIYAETIIHWCGMHQPSGAVP